MSKVQVVFGRQGSRNSGWTGAHNDQIIHGRVATEPDLAMLSTAASPCSTLFLIKPMPPSSPAM
ncbi:MAG: hypothetical protein R2778_07690 [Saprospiraceae bacterium]